MGLSTGARGEFHYTKGSFCVLKALISVKLGLVYANWLNCFIPFFVLLSCILVIPFLLS